MEDNSGQVPDQADLADMADQYGMDSVPNLADDQNLWAKFESDYGIPSYAFIAPDMTVLAVDTYSTEPSSWLP